MTAPWLHVVGVTEAGAEALPAPTRALIEGAEIVIGVPRRLAGIETGGRQLVAWDGGLDEMLDRVAGFANRPTVLLASGDPNWFGIGATLVRHLPPEEFAVHPAPSSFQLAASRLHWPMQRLSTVSLHGRDVALVLPHIQPDNRVLALTTDATTPATVGDLLVRRGYGRSRLTVLENLGAPSERVVSFAACEAAGQPFGDFHVLAIDCRADNGAPLLPTVPGLPDDAFEHDGQLTKREVRAITLARLAPTPGALLWDVGAGCGSVAIEWMRAASHARAVAVERNEARLRMIAANAEALGAPGLVIAAAEAPSGLDALQAPDAVFHGGDVANGAIFERCWSALPGGGRLVANAVTLAAEAALIARQSAHGGELTRIGVERLDTVGARPVLRPAMTVTQWAVTKGRET